MSLSSLLSVLSIRTTDVLVCPWHVPGTWHAPLPSVSPHGCVDGHTHTHPQHKPPSPNTSLCIAHTSPPLCASATCRHTLYTQPATCVGTPHPPHPCHSVTHHPRMVAPHGAPKVFHAQQIVFKRHGAPHSCSPASSLGPNCRQHKPADTSMLCLGPGSHHRPAVEYHDSQQATTLTLHSHLLPLRLWTRQVAAAGGCWVRLC